MSEKTDSRDKLDQLSLLIDELNAGSKPYTADEETAELLHVADLLRREGRAVIPPQHILEQTVDRAIDGINKSQLKSSRSWWYSGVFSAAAAALVFLGLQLFPSWQQQQPVAISPPSLAREQASPPKQGSVDTLQTVTEAKASADAKPQAAAPPAQGEEFVPLAPTAPPATSAPSVTAPPGIESALSRQAPSQKQPDLPASAPMPAQQHSRDAAAAPERVKPPVAAKAAVEERQYSNTKSLPFEHSTVSLPDNSALPLTPLTLPGKTADVIAIDQHSGTVRQVFFQGTPREVTIIQRIAAGNSPETAASSRLQSGADQAADSKKTGLTTVQLTIGSQNVELQGRCSRQELLQLADSLR